jgi:PAS domain S-box-containing protein
MDIALIFVIVGLIGALAYLCSRWRRSVDQIAEQAERLAYGGNPGGRRVATSVLTRLKGALIELEAQAASAEVRMQTERERRAATETALRESEERYALALRCSNDGLWEWDVKRDVTLLSPRWKAMLGFANTELGSDPAEWRARIHGEDQARVLAQLELCLNGEAPEFESEFRLLRKDGSARWVLSRGTALRHATGRAYRFVGLDTDITEVKRASEILMRVAAGTAAATGDEFFHRLVENFASALGVRIAFITECANQPATRVRTLAWWDGSGFRPNFEFELAGTPCQAVIEGGETHFHPRRVNKLFPNERMESYLGIPIFDHGGDVIGHLAFFDEKPMLDDMLLDAVYRIFTSRASAELQRKNALHKLAALSH